MPELTREEILAMPAGYAANVIIDMFVFGIEPAADQIDLYLDDDGWCVNPKTKRRIRTADRLPLPDYTGNISAAWEVEEHLYNFGQVVNSVMQRKYVIALSNVLEFDYGYESKALMIHATPHQRSRAALLAVMEK